LALAIAPALRPIEADALPLALELGREFVRGLPVAVGAALLVHVALMAGGAMDDLRGGRETSALPLFQGTTTPIGALLGLLVVCAFHAAGGPASLVAALLVEPGASGSVVAVTGRIVASVGLAVAASAPLAVVAIVLSVAEALIARAASPAHIAGLLAPLRGIALLGVAALVLDRVLVFLLSVGPSLGVR
jgi:type III secretory pathway component EscT